MKKMLFLLSLAAMTSGLFAQTKIALTNAKDSASYAYGIVLANSIKRQLSDNLNREVLIASLNATLKEESMLMTPEVANKVFSDYNRSVQMKASEKTRKEGLEFLENNKKRKEVTTTSSGLQYEVLKRGNGTVSPKETDKVEVHYHGTLINGEVFDSSVERGQPAQFGLNQVIKGWTEGLQYMKEGDKFKFYIPAELAYGERGAGGKIKPGSTLIFEVELLKIVK
ncbi:MAG: FKBP-type peptidyl-prolyl cis-trans isomerase [Saprospiraceae bacterium]